MGLKSIKEDANIILSSFIKWINCIRQPDLTYQNILYSVKNDEEKFRAAFQLWLATTCINFILLMPVFSLVDIEWNNLGFYLPILLYWFTVLILPALFLHLAFHLYKIDSKLSDTLVIYTIAVYCYVPFLIIIAEPWSVNTIEIFSKVKTQHSGFLETIRMVNIQYNELSKESIGFQIYQAFHFLVSALIIAYCLMIFQRMVVSFYKIDRVKVFLAMGFALGGLWYVPSRIALYFYYFIIYVEL